MADLQTTRAVVLRTVKHKDHAVVLRTYTENFGARSYLARTGGRAAHKPAQLQPLDRLELVVTESNERDLHTVRELRLLKPYLGVRAEPARGLVLLFAQEVFYRTLKEESPDAALFGFVMDVLEEIDSGHRLGHLPLMLLAQLAGHLGFLPELPRPGETHFDLLEGRFIAGAPRHGQFMAPQASTAFAALIRAAGGGPEMDLDPAARRELLGLLLTFYRLHVEGFGQLRSPAVLHMVMG